MADLIVNIETAVSFTANEILNYPREIPATLLVVDERGDLIRPLPFTLFNPLHLELSIMSDMRENLRAAGRKVAGLRKRQPSCVLSMLEVRSNQRDFWLSKGFFPAAAVPASFDGKDTVLLTATNALGETVRRLCELLPLSSSPYITGRKLGDSSQVELSGQPCEIDLFWETFTAVRRRSPGRGFGR